jgi:hypothetical protein
MKLLREWEEHSSRPGAVYENYLMLDGGFQVVLNEMNLHESVDDKGRKTIKFRGKFQEAGVVNKNKRMYTRDILEQNVGRLMEIINQNGLIGECDHPQDSIVHFANCSHKITKLWWEGDVVMGEGMVLHTPMGLLIMSLINDGVRIGMSSRGVGSGKVNEDGVLVISESYKLITFDSVADPSTHQAFQERVVSSPKHEVFSPKNEIFVPRRAKNVSRGIDTGNNSQLVLACLSGMVSTKTEREKERINS